MIAPLLPSIAADLAVSVTTAGLLVTVFALAYALSSPILTALTGAFDRRRLLIGALGAFAIANVVAWASPGFWALLGARVLLALAAGLYLPNAAAVAGALVAPERRGRALAIVTGGASVAIVIGVPLGAIIGGAGGWRTTFAGVAALAAIGTIGLLFGLPKEFGKQIPTATLRQRVDVARKPAVLFALLGTSVWATGVYTVYTYIAAYLAISIGTAGAPLSVVLFVWGVAALTGMILSGRLVDKLGPRRVLARALSGLVLAFMALSAIAAYVSPSYAQLPLLVVVVLWGAAAWAFVAPQQARLIGIAGVSVAPVALSLNASFMYAGFSLGAVLGGFTLSYGSAADLGWVGGLCEVVALAMLWISSDRDRSRS